MAIAYQPPGNRLIGDAVGGIDGAHLSRPIRGRLSAAPGVPTMGAMGSTIRALVAPWHGHPMPSSTADWLGERRRVLGVVVAGLCLAVVAGCGEGGIGPESARRGVAAGVVTPASEPESCATRGGALHVLDSSDFEHIDPGQAYLGLDYEVIYATQRPLYGYRPDTFSQLTPDMAEDLPVISRDRRTITIRIRRGVHFSPPVNREVTAGDVAYALERGANPNVANPYFAAYFSAIEGARSAKGGPIPGIKTVGRYTLVLHLSEPKAQIVADALVLPLSAPVPAQYARRYDSKTPSEYGDYQVATGPYMFLADADHRVLGTGYKPGESATLVRNPNWDARTDYRPACLDRIDISIGGAPNVIGRQVLEGSRMAENEPLASGIVQLAYQHFRHQLEISAGAGNQYVTLNNSSGPFTNVNLRRAVWAALDRVAMDRARGRRTGHARWRRTSSTLRSPASRRPEGSADRKSISTSTRPATAPCPPSTCASPATRAANTPAARSSRSSARTRPPTPRTHEIVDDTLQRLGFKTRLTLLEPAAMYSKYCAVLRERIDVCPSVGWRADFGDPQAVLDLAFNGRLIVANGYNSNWGAVNHPRINQAMTAAETIVGTGARARAWGAIDDALVAEAVAIPYDWDKDAYTESKDVAGVGDLWNTGSWDYSFTSLR